MLKILTCTAAIGIAGTASAEDIRTTVVAGGCFWCVEADFEKVDGVTEVVSGFAGGTVENPTYEQVTGGGTGHYEAVEITYDADTVSYEQIVDLFLRSIDPLDAEGQFCDRGPSYRTAIWVDGPEEKRIAEAEIAEAEGELGQEIVTPVLDSASFYPAGEYHQDYYRSQDRLAFSRFGVGVTKAEAYKGYREGCGRDARVRAIWGDDAPFVDH